MTVRAGKQRRRNFSQSYDLHLIILPISPIRRGRGGLVVRSRPWGRRVAGSKPDSIEDPSCIGPVACQIIRRGQTTSRWCGAEAWRGGDSSGVILLI
ncbi:hypothetical protein AVEN_179272-1 [Araneus ventricosus]|uniref:Uncharacterized protein n=1 Tax=Araneus ventricosus TaxID=182803 RepID=A0A4Y2V6S4_ARAVE|nr:hypothetical protein AVEN_179272-1 [Araneus ventricosus]